MPLKAQPVDLGQLVLSLKERWIAVEGAERIWVESEVGRGSTFSFTLPISHRPPLEPTMETEKR